jgi:hypothetical protein
MHATSTHPCEPEELNLRDPDAQGYRVRSATRHEWADLTVVAVSSGPATSATLRWTERWERPGGIVEPGGFERLSHPSDGESGWGQEGLPE